MIVSAGNNELFRYAKAIGVGLIDSAIGLSQLCLFDRPDFILFVGSAGSYGSKNIFDIVQSRSSSNIEHSFFKDKSYTPINNTIKADNKLVKDETIVNSSNYITTNKDICDLYIQKNIGIENMEFYAVMKVAQHFSIDVAGIFVVTNYCYEDAKEQFAKNHQKSKDILTTFLYQHNIITSCK
ncbi:MAG: purine-nucleoside phosphorylase [Campylobacteraceae bacterium 4484_166]|nr:MAG: purine-nucleoside phosphorylase [Campylobacteraceae bacterium 4484_166]